MQEKTMAADISTSTAILGDLPEDPADLEERIGLLAQAGFRYVEYSHPHDHWDQFLRAAEANAVAIWSVHGQLSGGAISASEEARRKSVDDEIARMEGYACAAPCPYVIHYLNRHHDPGVGTRFRRSIEELLPRAESLRVNLAVETAP